MGGEGVAWGAGGGGRCGIVNRSHGFTVFFQRTQSNQQEAIYHLKDYFVVLLKRIALCSFCKFLEGLNVGLVGRK